jgi:hypothetical protein
MPATGTRGTASLVARKYDVSDIISLLDVNRYPILAILTNAGKDPVTKKGEAMKKKETTDSEFKWYEDTYGTRRLTGSGTVDPDGGALTVTAQSAYAQIGDIVLVAAQKWVFAVTAVPDADTLTVGAEKGGATGSAASAVGDVWIIGNANMEGAGLRSIVGTTPSEKVGYCQIFRTPFGVTETARNTQTLIKENDFDYQRKKKAIEHMLDVERAFLFGKISKDTSGTHPKRYTQGILNIITTYATANVDTEAEFETWLEDAFAHGNVEKYFFASASVVSMINGWAKGKVTMVSTEKSYGIQITKYISPHGTVNIIKHPFLTGTTYGYYGIMIDMETLTYRYLSNRDTKLLTNRQAPGDDERVDEYLTECGLQMEQQERHAIMSKSSL